MSSLLEDMEWLAFTPLSLCEPRFREFASEAGMEYRRPRWTDEAEGYFRRDEYVALERWFLEGLKQVGNE